MEVILSIVGQIPILSVWVGTNNLCDVLAVVKELSKPLHFLESEESHSEPRVVRVKEVPKEKYLPPVSRTLKTSRSSSRSPRSSKASENQAEAKTSQVKKTNMAPLPLKSSVPVSKVTISKAPVSARRSSGASTRRDSIMTPRGTYSLSVLLNRRCSPCPVREKQALS